MDPGLDDLVCRILREGDGRRLRIRKTSLYHSGQPVNKRARKRQKRMAEMPSERRKKVRMYVCQVNGDAK